MQLNQSIKTGTAIAVLAVLAACAGDPALDKTVVPNETVIVSTLIDGDQGNTALFGELSGIAVDTAGNLYVADEHNDRIHKITPEKKISTHAGGKAGFADGQGGAAQFYQPTGIAIDAAGNLYVADKFNHSIRKVTPSGEVSTLAGGREGFADGLRNAAQFNRPSGITIDAAGNLYVVDRNNHSIRKVTQQGEVSTLAGGEQGFADGQGSTAQFAYPFDITIDTVGNLYVADSVNHRVRRVTPKGEVSTLAGGEEGFADGRGSAAQFRIPFGIVSGVAGNLYVADRLNHRIRKVTLNGEVSTLAGSEAGFVDGQGSSAQFDRPSCIAIDKAGNLYVADTDNHSIRKIEIRRP